MRCVQHTVVCAMGSAHTVVFDAKSVVSIMSLQLGLAFDFCLVFTATFKSFIRARSLIPLRVACKGDL